MMDFDQSPGKILKYDLKRGKFRSFGPPFEVWAPVKINPAGGHENYEKFISKNV
jgi:hypothetical protein